MLTHGLQPTGCDPKSLQKGVHPPVRLKPCPDWIFCSFCKTVSQLHVLPGRVYRLWASRISARGSFSLIRTLAARPTLSTPTLVTLVHSDVRGMLWPQITQRPFAVARLPSSEQRNLSFTEQSTCCHLLRSPSRPPNYHESSLDQPL